MDLGLRDSGRILHCGAIGIRVFLMRESSQRIVAEVGEFGLGKIRPEDCRGQRPRLQQ